MANRVPGVWFVTGASSGFGYAVTNAVLERGGRVVATSRSTAALADLQGKAGHRLLVVPLDVTSDADVTSAVAKAEAHFGHVDVLLNNAGYGLIGSIEESSDAEIQRQFDVNFYGQVRLIKALLPSMRRRKAGCIVNLSSMAAVSALGGAGYYAASKLAVEGMSEALRLELAPLGIRVLIVEPGPSRTSYITKGYLVYSDRSIPDYVETSGMMRKLIPTSHGSQRGDPARAAEAIIDAAEGDQPPLRLLLGAQCVDAIRANLRQRLSELEQWTTVSLSADFPEG